MTVRSLVAASIAVTAALAGIAATALSRLPANTRLPVHWGASGVANGFADAPVALFMPVVLCAVIAAAMIALPSIEPLQNRLDGSRGLYRTAWAALLVVCAVIEAQVAAPAFGVILPVSLPLMAPGLLLIVLGNALPKSRPGFFVGIRTPWTLSDPDNWVATHRLGARTMIAGGAIIVVAALLPIAPGTRAACVVAALILAVVPPIVFSFAYWQRHRAA